LAIEGTANNLEQVAAEKFTEKRLKEGDAMPHLIVKE
jgi:hypothetical protein